MESIRPGGKGLPDREALRRLRVLILDVDGVLTDGLLGIDSQGVETKFYDVRDGVGLALLKEAGWPVALLSGRRSAGVEQRARDLGIPLQRVRQGARDKLPAYRELLAECGARDPEVAYMGDDLIDLPILNCVGLAACPADAGADLPAACHAIATLGGGRGAVRSLCEFLLRSREDGSWEKAVRGYLGRDPSA